MLTFKNHLILSILTIAILSGCGSSSNTTEFPVSKRFWDSSDYGAVINKIKFIKKSDPRPSYGSPEYRAVFEKMVDVQNIDVVAQDDALGLSHRSQFTTELFQRWDDMVNLYSDRDREDNFVYGEELVDILKFGLHLQMEYFELGNQEILKSADNPNSPKVQKMVIGNQTTMLNNFSIYLDYVKYESAFSAAALKKYESGIDIYFGKAIKKYPKANFSKLLNKANNMLARAENTSLKSSLANLVAMIEDRPSE